MATTDYLKEEYNIMSQFCNLSELQSSSDEEENVINKLNINQPTIAKKKKVEKTQPITIIRPTKPQNNNSQFDLSQFCDLTQLESSDDDIDDTQKQNYNQTNKVAEEKKIEFKNENENEPNSITKQPKIKNKKNNKLSTDDSKSEIPQEKICPFRKILMFATHLHLCGVILPKWMTNVLTLFSDSNSQSCHEAASLGKKQRKLFLDTICKCTEPQNMIYVNTKKSVIINEKNDCNYAIVNVSKENTKYSDLQSIDGHKLIEIITNQSNLTINKGIYLFFNQKYKVLYLDFFLYKNTGNISYFCEEYRIRQRLHIKKVLKLDYGINNKYSEWFLSIYDKNVSIFEENRNGCYELLASNIKFWKDLILQKKAMQIQFTIDHTFIVKTIYCSKWIDDQRRNYCSYKNCNVKFGVVNRKHHCRACGDIFCKIHCLKALYRRNRSLESINKKKNNVYYNQSRNRNENMSMLIDDDLFKNEREMRICPSCKEKKYLFVDVPHKHFFMNCKCLKWSVEDIDFRKEWERFIAQMQYM